MSTRAAIGMMTHLDTGRMLMISTSGSRHLLSGVNCMFLGLRAAHLGHSFYMWMANSIKLLMLIKQVTMQRTSQLVSISLQSKYHTVKIVVNKGRVTIDGPYFKPDGLTRVAWNSLTLTGSWSRDDGNCGGDTTLGNYTKNSGDFVQYTFTGYYFMISGTISHNYQSIDLYVDDARLKTESCTYRKRNLKAMLFSYLLAQGSHTVKIISNGGLIGFSGFYTGSYITVPLAQDNFFINHPDETLVINMEVANKSADWQNDGNAGYGMWTGKQGGWAEASFVGSALYILGSKSQWASKFDLYIDGIWNQTVNTNNGGARVNHVQLVTVSLEPGYHTAKIVFTESTNSISIDGFYFKPDELKRLPFNQLQFIGTWDKDASKWGGDDYIGNWTETAGSYVEGTFKGSYLMVSETIASNYNIVGLKIDNEITSSINCNYQRRDLKAMIYATELTQVEHTTRFSYNNGLIGFSGFYIGNYYTFHECLEFGNVGSWLIGGNTNDKHQWTSGTDDSQSMELVVKCTGVAIKGILDPGHGYMDVSVDDIVIATINQYNANRIVGAILYSFVVPLGYHKIKLTRNKKNNNPIDIHGIFTLDNYGAGSFNLGQKQITVEGGQNFTITITRSGGSNGISGVDVTFIDGTANNEHYSATNQELKFLKGETSKQITITTAVKEYKKTTRVSFTIKLSNPKHFGILGDLNKTEVTIEYIPPPTIKFTQSGFFIASMIYIFVSTVCI